MYPGSKMFPLLGVFDATAPEATVPLAITETVDASAREWPTSVGAVAVEEKDTAVPERLRAPDVARVIMPLPLGPAAATKASLMVDKYTAV